MYKKQKIIIVGFLILVIIILGLIFILKNKDTKELEKKPNDDTKIIKEISKNLDELFENKKSEKLSLCGNNCYEITKGDEKIKIIKKDKEININNKKYNINNDFNLNVMNLLEIKKENNKIIVLNSEVNIIIDFNNLKKDNINKKYLIKNNNPNLDYIDLKEGETAIISQGAQV